MLLAGTASAQAPSTPEAKPNPSVSTSTAASPQAPAAAPLPPLPGEGAPASGGAPPAAGAAAATSPSGRSALEAPASPPAPLSLPAPLPASVPAIGPLSEAAHATAPAPQPLAGFHNGTFYLRDEKDNFRLYVNGRMQVDMNSYFGPGVSQSTRQLRPTVLLRRIRPELAGEFLKNWQWLLAGDWGTTALDNADGTNETSAAAVGRAPTASTSRYASAQTAAIRGGPTDVFINYRADRLFNVQVGQYNAPFTMENRTSDKYLPFNERSLAVRVLGIPTNKEIGAMAWGEAKDRLVYYAVGVFNGDGQNRLNVDSRADVIGSVVFQPLSRMADVGELKHLQIGASGRFGVRDSRYVLYDYAAMTTQGGYQFWGPTYTSSMAPGTVGNAGTNGRVHVLPSGSQGGIAGELRIPVSDFDLTGEFVYVRNQTREATEGAPTNTLRRGEMEGHSYYVQLGYWPLGNRDINGIPGYGGPAHLDLSKPQQSPKSALQLLVKWEQLQTTYKSASRAGIADSRGIDGDVKVNALSLGANYWATKHIRLGANYVYNMFPDSGPSAGATQRAQAPGQTLAAGVNDEARNNGHALHELLLRAGVAF